MSICILYYNIKIIYKSYNYHCIAEAEESVFFIDGGFISVHSFIITAKGADKHYQRALGQMEIGHKRINALELITGVNENVGPVVILANLALGGAYRLKRAAAGGADGDCPFAVCLD